MIGWFMNNELERMWKEAVVAYFKYYPGIFLEEPRKTSVMTARSSEVIYHIHSHMQPVKQVLVSSFGVGITESFLCKDTISVPLVSC
jgi:hypothetical protein